MKRFQKTTQQSGSGSCARRWIIILLIGVLDSVVAVQVADAGGRVTVSIHEGDSTIFVGDSVELKAKHSGFEETPSGWQTWVGDEDHSGSSYDGTNSKSYPEAPNNLNTPWSWVFTAVETGTFKNWAKASVGDNPQGRKSIRVTGNDVAVSLSETSALVGEELEMKAKLKSLTPDRTIIFSAEGYVEDSSTWEELGSPWPISGQTDASGSTPAIPVPDLAKGEYRITATYPEVPDDKEDRGSLVMEILKVEIKKPIGSGVGLEASATPEEKEAFKKSWDTATNRFDFQGVTSSSPGSYAIKIKGKFDPDDSNAEPEWTLEPGAGTLTDDDGMNPKHVAPAAAGGGILTLVGKSSDGIKTFGLPDSRTLTIYEDHLARNYANFSGAGSCKGPWEFSAFGVEIEITET